MQTWQVTPDIANERRGRIIGPHIDAPCALGRAGVVDAGQKKEGDGKTPTGIYPFRRVFYRPDKMVAPVCALGVLAISTELGWCDDTSSPRYNNLIRLPFAASHEKMWREDTLYDLILVIGHNDDPPVPGLGSAIFVHVAKDGFEPTEGCIALAEPALLTLLRAIRPGDQLKIC